MKTKIIDIRDEKCRTEGISLAAEIIRQGGLVAFPTETVYGLGADAMNEEAVKKIYKAKGRPSDNPLIAHIANISEVEILAEKITEKAYALMKAFWPGSLSIILPRKNIVSNAVTGGLSTVAIRMPKNIEARELIEKSGCPIVAPSANISGKPSPTKAEHVIDDLSGKVDAILLGQDCEVGLESTVIDMTVEPPAILRPGIITKEDIEAVIGRVQMNRGTVSEDNAPKAPGMKYKHYAPKAPVILFEGELEKVISEINKRKAIEEANGKRVGIIASDETFSQYTGLVYSTGSRKNLKTVAKRIFDTLRHFDSENVDLILSESFEQKGVGFAVMNRLLKSAGYTVVFV